MYFKLNKTESKLFGEFTKVVGDGSNYYNKYIDTYLINDLAIVIDSNDTANFHLESSSNILSTSITIEDVFLLSLG